MPKTTSLNTKNIIIIIAILMCFVSIGYGIYEYWKRYSSQSDIVQSKNIQIIKLELNKLESLTPRTDDSEKVDKYIANHDNFLVEANLDWGSDDSDKFVLLCDFATRMLKYYNGKPESKKYLDIANFIILKINDRVFKTSYTVITKDTSYKTLIYLTRLLNTFEYLAKDIYPVTKNICHNQILYLMPEYNKVYQDTSVSAHLKNEQVIYTIIPRLLTNMKSDKTLYNYDVNKQKVLEELKTQFNVLKKSPEKASNFILMDYHLGIYEGLI
ncbi:putative envelope protein ODV-E66-16 [Microplitis demolitor]|uniref:putative envelope protein ODV-E66-16 n=1 Tax=Microplitis demolitor TaxID=69319 RepID=UPI000440001D|nr:putative envelope protein ODV-E66-16 [Microplitis demolitor]KAG6558317.1 putative envelope protein ODV-E66-16 [Microplitis demolitor]